ncbi:tyrosine-type recombinase/integrase [Sphingobium sp. B11D3A]|uniref:tyrosine-type recombinase/integrase n=1 Tax=Sphingobium sp. B11D3A TaxID=2940574 RepID=UPI002224134E|nr:site-specific integrase [Sphingobium sp. B11D3A]MCW2392271.1 integrase/recombinase XerD [Sphingobium sp. B11D3A]
MKVIRKIADIMLQKQAKLLNVSQEKAVLNYLAATRYSVRNRAIFLLSIRAGLRAKEIAALTWGMVTDAEGSVSDSLQLLNIATKGNSGGVIPIARDLKSTLCELYATNFATTGECRVILTQRSRKTSAQVIVNLFSHWYRELGFEGCSSHSGRRTFITRAARNISKFGGSIRDVQELARHRSLVMTQRYIDVDREALRKVVELASL